MSVTLQIELPPGDAALLQEWAHRRGVTVSELVQHLLHEFTAAPAEALTDEQYADDPLWSITGLTHTEVGDTSVQHDHYLYPKDA